MRKLAENAAESALAQGAVNGPKKHMARTDSNQTKAIGIALNTLDKAAIAIRFVKELVEAGQQLRVRWHPGQFERDIQHYMTVFGDIPQIALSNPKTESVSDFMAQIRWLVAGNSSIHLEAALAGIAPIYYELTPPNTTDYYGYVKHGLAKPANSADDTLKMVNAESGAEEPDFEAVWYYSVIYPTDGDGSEGELVAECLSSILQGDELAVRGAQLVDPKTSFSNSLLDIKIWYEIFMLSHFLPH